MWALCGVSLSDQLVVEVESERHLTLLLGQVTGWICYGWLRSLLIGSTELLAPNFDVFHDLILRLFSNSGHQARCDAMHGEHL